MAKNQELASIISTIKIRCNMRQAEVAEKLGVNKSYLSDTINGRYPYSDGMLKRNVLAKEKFCVYKTLNNNWIDVVARKVL